MSMGKMFQRVNDDTFLTHVVHDHLDHEKDAGKSTDNSTFQCEWINCNFMNNDYNSLLDHLKSHQPSKYILPTQASSANALTPLSCSISNAASPAVLQQPASTQPTINELNITSMKIMPKTRKKQTEQDPEFRCHWQVGTDDEGNPISCDLKHENEGDLQNHILEHHIGSGNQNTVVDGLVVSVIMGKFSHNVKNLFVIFIFIQIINLVNVIFVELVLL